MMIFRFSCDFTELWLSTLEFKLNNKQFIENPFQVKAKNENYMQRKKKQVRKKIA